MFKVLLEEAKDTFLWWSKHERQFMIVDYLATAILSILGNQIEIERVFSSVGILTSLC
jgi:hypothetical protein